MVLIEDNANHASSDSDKKKSSVEKTFQKNIKKTKSFTQEVHERLTLT